MVFHQAYCPEGRAQIMNELKTWKICVQEPADTFVEYRALATVTLQAQSIGMFA